MSTELKEAGADKKNAHQLELTNGAIYLLEGCLQELGPCSTPDKIIKWAKCWKYIRAQNDRLVDVPWSDEPVDFEKPILPKPGEDVTSDTRQVRAAELNQAHDKWVKQPKVLGLSDKRRDVCREALKYWVAHKSDGKARGMAMSENLLLLLEAFDIGEADPSADNDE